MGMFGFRVLKKNPELIPLVTAISLACTGAVSYMIYGLATKPDVRVVRSRGAAHEDVAPTECRKIVNVNEQAYREIPELERLKKEIGSYKS